MTVALITGMTGQDGSYLTELLLSKGYTVHGLVRHGSQRNVERLGQTLERSIGARSAPVVHYADLQEPGTYRRVLAAIAPDEIYHLAGPSHVGASFANPESCQFTTIGTLHLLEALREMPSPARLLHISSSEIFGRPSVAPQNEKTPMKPVSPYGIAKTFATQMVQLYRDTFELFVCNAICYNHESPRRHESFVTRKISRAVARIALGYQDRLELGTLSSRRDWGYAPEYVDGMWRILQQQRPADFILATGSSSSVEDFLDASFKFVGLDWTSYVAHDPGLQRPIESAGLVGDNRLAKSTLEWHPQIQLPELAHLMVRHDLDELRGSL